MLNYYEILKIRPDADEETVKAAYRTMMFKYRIHPDLGGDEELAREIGEAYQVLGDAESRHRYDLSMGHIDPSDGDKRRIVRVETNIMVGYQVSESEGFLPAKLADLSFLGCKLQSQGQIPKDEMISINILGHTIQGIVRWHRMFHPNRFTRIYEIGVEFLREFEEIDQIELESGTCT